MESNFSKLTAEQFETKFSKLLQVLFEISFNQPKNLIVTDETVVKFVFDNFDKLKTENCENIVAYFCILLGVKNKEKKTEYLSFLTNYIKKLNVETRDCFGNIYVVDSIIKRLFK